MGSLLPREQMLHASMRLHGPIRRRLQSGSWHPSLPRSLTASVVLTDAGGCSRGQADTIGHSLRFTSIFHWFLLVAVLSCSDSSSSPPGDPCAAIDHCTTISVNALL